MSKSALTHDPPWGSRGMPLLPENFLDSRSSEMGSSAI